MVATANGGTIAVVQKETDALAAQVGALSVDVLDAQVKLIQQVMRRVMHRGEHYGVIPGTGKKCEACDGKGKKGNVVCQECGGGGTKGKPSLLKPGAEKLGLVFKLAPKFRVRIIEMGNGHRDYEVTCVLKSRSTGEFIGEGVGSCSTMESKYRWRNPARVCPHCGKESIIKGKEEYGGGWLCFKKKDGCNAKFPDGDPAIEGQVVGKMENPDIADCYNTVKKMAKKRAHVDAILTATAASDIFTQDIEDMVPDTQPAHHDDHEPAQPRIDQIPGLKRGSDLPQPAAKDDPVATIRAWLAKSPTLDKLNEGLVEIEELTAAQQDTLKPDVKAYAKSRGWKWNRDVTAFVDPAAPVPVGDAAE